VGGEGIVYGTEIDPELIDNLRERVALGGLANVRILEAKVDATGLPSGCCDAVVLRHVYHHLTDPIAVLRDIHRALKSGGRLLVIDFRPTVLLAPFTPDDLPEGHSGHGVTPELVVKEAESAGFTVVNVQDDWPGSHPLMDRFAVLLEIRS
jgi:ubiquinone/menaquinone biosynthesis C-methylase UbiE